MKLSRTRAWFSEASLPARQRNGGRPAGSEQLSSAPACVGAPAVPIAYEDRLVVTVGHSSVKSTSEGHFGLPDFSKLADKP
jgi:hypothetical protein